jgi:TM2 domain-containing membrane protein YozV
MSYEQPPAGYNTPNQDPGNGPSLFGITWQKNLVPIAPSQAGRPPRNTLLAYVLWFFLGMFGVHQYYLGNFKRGLMILAVWILAAITSGIFIGVVIGFALFVYWIYEAITLQEQIQEVHNGLVRQSVL